MSAMFLVPNHPRSLVAIATLNIQNHPRTAPDGKVVIKEPLLIAIPVGAECDDVATVVGPCDVQNKTETRNTC
jgi:hypothetical protein